MNPTMKLLGILTLPAALAFTTLNARADSAGSATADDRTTGLFIGGHYGRFSSDSETFDEDNDFYDVVIGGLITPYFGVEAGYSDFGKLEGDFAEVDLTGYSLAGLLRLPIGNAVGLYAKAGQFWWRSDINVEVLGQRYATDITGNEPFYGVGMDFFVTDNVAIDVEYLRYQVDLEDSSLPDAIDDYETDIDTAKVGAKLYF
ncbi:MAG: outer membrane beta-barrel protein [Gammaproteobacteria bacterium]